MKKFNHEANDKYSKIINEYLDNETEENAVFIEDFCGLEFVEKHDIDNEKELREKLESLKSNNFKIVKYFHAYRLYK